MLAPLISKNCAQKCAVVSVERNPPGPKVQ